MIDTLKKLNTMLSPKERLQARLVFLLMLSMALMEMIGVASIMPFVAVLANPGVVETNQYLATAYNALGFSSTDTFLFFLSVMVFVLFLSSLAFKALTTYVIIRFSTMRLHTITCRLLGAYLHQPYAFFLNHNTADLSKSILSEVNQMISGVLIPSMRAISGVVVAAALLGLLLLVESLISLSVAMLLGGSYAAVYFLARPLLRRIGEDRLRANAQRYVLASEVLSGIKELKLMGRDHVYLDRFKDPSERFARHQAVSKVLSDLPQFAIQAVAFGGVLLIVLYIMGRHEGPEGALPLIALYAFVGYRLMPAFQEIFSNLTQLRFSLPALEHLYDDLTLKEKHAIRSRQKASKPLHLSESIRLENVTYRYPGADTDALKGIRLTIPAGSSAGLVGSTGAGKSTTVDIILSLLTPSSGQVLVDGCPLTSANQRAWQDNIGYVPQSIYLADDTVAANIAFGMPAQHIDREAVERAARTAHIHDFIVSELSQGYETVVGERGIRLSGGQRQRIAIARALYHDPDVVVFDEATSALDNATERAVMEAIEALHSRKTVIIIAHRLSTVRACDRIFVFQNGTLVDEDTYEALMEYSSGFRLLTTATGGSD